MMNMTEVSADTNTHFYKHIKKIPQIIRFYPINMEDSDTI